MNATVTRNEPNRKLLSATRPTLVEALPEKYCADKHLPNALNIPHDQVEALAPALLPNKSDEIVVYCANIQCRNSHTAARRLTLLGYTNVAVYPDGKQGGEDVGLPFDSVTESSMAA